MNPLHPDSPPEDPDHSKAHPQEEARAEEEEEAPERKSPPSPGMVTTATGHQMPIPLVSSVSRDATEDFELVPIKDRMRVFQVNRFLLHLYGVSQLNGNFDYNLQG